MSDTPGAILAAAITRLNDRIDALPTIREASVAAVNPLAVQFDTDTSPTLAHGSLASSVSVGTRVLTLKLRHYIWVLGAKGGDTPAGAGMEFFGTTPPPGWLLQDGTVYLRADYPALYAAIGTAYNTGGETALQFRVPNKKGRVGVGLDASQTEFNTSGKTGGAKTHTLSYRELPTQKGVRMTWGQGNIAFDPASNAYQGRPPANSLGTFQHDARYDADSANNMSQGGQPHNNLQPYLVHNYIIKT